MLHHDGRPLTAEAVRDAVRAECAAAGAPAPPDIMVVSLFAGGGHDPGSGPLPAGKPIEIDLWPRDEASGCWADMTRTFVGAGEVTDEVAALRDIAREALEAARAAARPGVTGRALYDAACDVVERAGYPTQRTRKPGETLDHGFYFGLGHGVGLEVHEPPGLGLSGHDELVARRRRRDRAGHRGHRGHRRRPLRGPPPDHGGRERDPDRLPLRPLRPAAHTSRREKAPDARQEPFEQPEHAGEQTADDAPETAQHAHPTPRALARPLADRPAPRVRAPLPLAFVLWLPVTLPTASRTRPAIRSMVPSVLSRRFVFMSPLFPKGARAENRSFRG